MEQEIEQLILRAILMYGYRAIPLDYSFLMKFKLKEAFFIGVKNSIEGVHSDNYNNILRIIISPYLVNTDFSELSSLYHTSGKKSIMSHIYNNELYYKLFKSQIKK